MKILVNALSSLTAMSACVFTIHFLHFLLAFWTRWVVKLLFRGRQHADVRDVCCVVRRVDLHSANTDEQQKAVAAAGIGRIYGNQMEEKQEEEKPRGKVKNFVE